MTPEELMNQILRERAARASLLAQIDSVQFDNARFTPKIESTREFGPHHEPNELHDQIVFAAWPSLRDAVTRREAAIRAKVTVTRVPHLGTSHGEPLDFVDGRNCFAWLSAQCVDPFRGEKEAAPLIAGGDYEGGHVNDANFKTTRIAPFDIDGTTDDHVRRVHDAITLANLDGFAYFTANDGKPKLNGDGSVKTEPGLRRLRLLFVLSRLVDDKTDYLRLRAEIERRFELHSDPKANDLSHRFFLPTKKSDGPVPFTVFKGKPIDVDAFLEVAPEITPAPRSIDVTEADTTPTRTVDLAEYVATLKAVRGEHAEAAGRALKGEALWPVGGRNSTLLSFAGTVGALLPDGTADDWRVVLRPSFEAMDAAKPPDVGGTWADVFADQFNRTIDEKRARAREQREAQAIGQAAFDLKSPPAPVPASAAERTFESERRRAVEELQAYRGKATSGPSRRLKFTSGADLLTKDLAGTLWLVGGILTSMAVAVIAGEPKTSKTWAALTLALAIATGTKAFGEFSAKGGPAHVALFLAEDDERSVRDRLKAIAKGAGLDVEAALSRAHVTCRAALNIADDDDLCTLIAETRMLPEPPALIVIDPLRDVHNEEENDSGGMAKVMHQLRALREITKAAVLFIHHLGKSGGPSDKRRAGQKMRGSSAIHGAIDGGFYMTFHDGNGVNQWTNNVEVELKAARGAGVFDLTLTVEDDESGVAQVARWGVVKERAGLSEQATEKSVKKVAADQLRKAIVAMVAAGNFSQRSLVTQCKEGRLGSEAQTQKAIAALIVDKTIRQVTTRPDGAKLPTNEWHYELIETKPGTAYGAQKKSDS